MVVEGLDFLVAALFGKNLCCKGGEHPSYWEVEPELWTRNIGIKTKLKYLSMSLRGFHGSGVEGDETTRKFAKIEYVKSEESNPSLVEW